MSNSRIEVPGGTYHVNANALDGMLLFRDDVDRLAYLDLLIAEAERSRWTFFTYTLMSTHFHAILRIEETTLSSGFQHLQSLYGRRYNRRHNRRGVVWQRRFHDVLVDSERHLFEAIRYDALNAPRANMCAKPEDWPWCFYGAAIGTHPADPLVDERELLMLFGRDLGTARRRLREYVEEKDPREGWRQTQLRRTPEARQTPRVRREGARRPRRGGRRLS